MNSKSRSMGSHHKSIPETNVWLTPPAIIQQLGKFDLDPCAPVSRIWETAANYFTEIDDGLAQKWFGRVWLNPPYDRRTINDWMKKMAMHQNGIALVFARTDTDWFHNFVFPYANGILFLNKRLTFFREDGTPGSGNGGAPNVLVSYTRRDSEILADSNISGHFQPVQTNVLIVVGTSPSWRHVVSISLTHLKGFARTDEIYQMVERIAPDKVRRNRNFKAKIRQQLQLNFQNVSRGYYTNQSK